MQLSTRYYSAWSTEKKVSIMQYLGCFLANFGPEIGSTPFFFSFFLLLVNFTEKNLAMPGVFFGFF